MLTIEQAKQKCLPEYTLLDTQFFGRKHFYEFRCNKCTNIVKRSYEHIMKKPKCRHCYTKYISQKLTFSFETMKHKLPYNLLLLSDKSEYKNAKSKLKFHCRYCDRDFETLVCYIYKRTNEDFYCPCCYPEKSGMKNKRKIREREYHELLKQNNPTVEWIDGELKSTKSRLTFRCKKCNNEWTTMAGNTIKRKSGRKHPTACPNCCLKGRSKKEMDIAEYIAKHTVYKLEFNIRNIPNILNEEQFFEIDIYIPELKIGFEFDGTYWHSDKVIKRRMHMTANKYHKLKDLSANCIGIKLFHIKEEDYDRNKQAVYMDVLGIINIMKNRI